MVIRAKCSYQLLIADDDPGFRDVLKSVFEPYFELLEAESGEEAVFLFEHNRVDLALFDMHMQELTGLETVRLVKTICAVTPCILITADLTEELRRLASEADAWSVLRKPVTKRDLVTTVSTALEEVYQDPGVRSLLCAN